MGLVSSCALSGGDDEVGEKRPKPKKSSRYKKRKNDSFEMVVAESQEHSVNKLPRIFAGGVGITCMVPRSTTSSHLSHEVLLGSDDGSAAHVNISTGRVRQVWPRVHERDILGMSTVVQCSDGTARFLTCSRDRQIHLHDVMAEAAGDGEAAAVAPVTPKATLSGHTLPVTCVDYHPSGSIAVSGGRDTTVRLWDVEKEAQYYCCATPLNLVRCLHFLPELRCVAQGGEDRTIRVWDIRSGSAGFSLEWTRTAEGLAYFATCAVTAGDTTYVTGHNGVNGCGSHIKEWDLRNTVREVCSHEGHSSGVASLSQWHQAPPGNSSASLMVSGSNDSELHLWSLGEANSQDHMTLQDGQLTALVCCGELYGGTGAVAVGMNDGGLLVLRHADYDAELPSAAAPSSASLLLPTHCASSFTS